MNTPINRRYVDYHKGEPSLHSLLASNHIVIDKEEHTIILTMLDLNIKLAKRTSLNNYKEKCRKQKKNIYNHF
jgi:hypothetical protein